MTLNLGVNVNYLIKYVSELAETTSKNRWKFAQKKNDAWEKYTLSHTSVPTFFLGIGYDMDIYPQYSYPKYPKKIEYLGMNIG